jgi:hypothetical protein
MPLIRRLLAFLSSRGIAAGIFVYIESFYGATLGSSLNWIVPLGIGAFAIHSSIYAVEKDRAYFSKEFARDMPSWVAPCLKLTGLIVLAHLVWFAVQGDFALPTVEDGQYVLDSHGRILKILTQMEYLRLKEGELRIVVALMISFYFPAMMYWWFRRNLQQVN